MDMRKFLVTGNTVVYKGGDKRFVMEINGTKYLMDSNGIICNDNIKYNADGTHNYRSFSDLDIVAIYKPNNHSDINEIINTKKDNLVWAKRNLLSKSELKVGKTYKCDKTEFLYKPVLKFKDSDRWNTSVCYNEDKQFYEVD